MARVIHPNVVPIYGVQTYDGRVGFWTAFVRGKTLSALLDANGAFGAREAVHIGVDLCRALSAVHGAGLLHRDIKAGNAMREEGGRILLMDFGLTHERDGQSHFGGTPGYIAPELLAGEKATVRSDIYALGVVIYRLLTDRHPSADAAATWALLEQRPDLPPVLVRAIHTAIDPDPAKRFANAAQMAAALSEADSEAGSVSAVTAASVLPAPPAESRPSGWRFAWAGMALLAVAAAGYTLRDRWLPDAGGALSATTHQRYEEAHDLVRNYYRPGALAKAIPMLEAITKEDPAFAPAFADLARANYQQFSQNRDTSFVEPARQASLKAIAIDKNQASAHTTLGMLYTLLSKNELATQELDTAEKLDRRDAEVWGARAELCQRQGRSDDAKNALQKAIDLAPSDWRWPKLLADYYDRTGQEDLAIRADQDALRLSPENARILNNLGLYLWSADRLQEARAAMQKAVTLEPGYSHYTNLGMVEIDLGNNADAIGLFRKAIELNPRDYRAWSYLADVYQRQHEDAALVRKTYQESITRGEELLKTEPNNAFLLADLGVMNATIGDNAKADPLVRQAAALDPDNGDTLFLAGVAYEIMKRRPEALEFIGSALRHGYQLKLVERSPSLASLRTDKKYLAIVASLR